MIEKFENAIIINGKVYILVDDGMSAECCRCALSQYCEHHVSEGRQLCFMLGIDENSGARFICIGENAEIKFD